MSGPPAGPAQPAPGGRAACLELAAHIRALQAELAGADAGSNEQRSFAEDLAAALLENHQRGCAPAQSEVSDVDTAIGYADQLLSGEPHGSRSRARFIAAVARYNRFLESENPADLDIAIWHASAIAAAEDPPAEAVALRGGALSLLGDALALRYRMAPDGAPTQLPDLSAAIAVLALLRRRLADDDPAKVFCVEDLATLHYDRHLLRADGDDADLSGAIDCLRWLRSAASHLMTGCWRR